MDNNTNLNEQTNNQPDHEEWAMQVAAYAADALPVTEIAQIRQHIDICPPCTRLLEELRETLASLVYTLNPVKPSPGLKISIQQRIKAERPKTPEPLQAKHIPYTTLQPPTQPGLKKKPAALRRSNWQYAVLNYRSLAAAVVLVSISMSGLFSYQKYNDTKTLEDKDKQINTLVSSMATVSIEATTVSYQVATVMARSKEEEQVNILMTAPDTHMMPLHADLASYTAKGQIVFSPSMQEMALVISHMPPPEEHHCYQVWLMYKGQSISGGTFWTSDPNQAMAMMVHPSNPAINAAKADIFEITQEPWNGSSQPTSNQLLSVNMSNQ